MRARFAAVAGLGLGVGIASVLSVAGIAGAATTTTTTTIQPGTMVRLLCPNGTTMQRRVQSTSDWTLACSKPVTTTTAPATSAPATTAPPATSAPTVAPTSTAPSAAPTSSAPSSSAFPDTTNTGFSGTLTRGPNVISAPGVYSNLDIVGPLVLNGPGITLRNCRVTGADSVGVINTRNAPGAVIDHCTINGGGTAEGSNGVIGNFAAVTNSNIYGVENGITPENANQTMSNNFVHGLKAPGSPHYDGIQIDGGQSNLVIDHNTVIDDYDQTSAIMIDNYFGSINGIRVSNNRLVGGGYTVYSDGQFSGGSIVGVSFTGNRMVKGAWGYDDLNKNTPTFSGNVDDATGNVITP